MTQNRENHAQLTIDEQGIATLRMANAGSLNILSTPVIKALRVALAEIAENDDVRVVIMRGDGDKAFIAGADIKEMADLDKTSAEAFIDQLRQLCDDVRHLRVPVIARIPGWCLGGGLEFALACDLRIGSDQAKLGMPEVKVGIPSIIHAALLPRIVGQARTNWLLLTGEILDAGESLEYGLLNRVVPADELDKEIDRVAKLMAGFGPVVVAQQKRLLREWEQEPLETSILNGVKEFAQAFDTGEPQRYMGEFVQAQKQKSR
ncbi:enoyl-CoA hydratase [Achromobacter sp. F4_2707]|uniref:enoyl-CoA hydratase n=1 Tax=Achromobacter sp. F4_2707 TaxID=3114286 RepID=UPI0039C60FB1